MSCGRDTESELQSFVKQLTDEREVVIAAPDLKKVGDAFRALAVAFGNVETRTDEEIYREAQRMFGVEEKPKPKVFFVSSQQTGRSHIYSAVFDEIETRMLGTNDSYAEQLAQAFAESPSWLRPVSEFEARYRNEHPDQQARIQAHQKRARNSPAPVNGKKFPRKRFV